MNRNSRFLLTFLAGASLGLVVTYLTNSEKGDEALDEVRDFFRRTRDDISDRLGVHQDEVDDEIINSASQL